ncbi:seryl-tRNA synthetase [Vulcanisaeta moutnovskia 768-28]|uniref:Serine--tRNA ligase n=1 Tax=Vulcanisaeta moutnovskia (strain 768-28) TaxID=985053 RepID=F0QU69_VULM7|nr:serine--tRNA ligase [Vulcanisaeta moutnovskia]ADY00609.1 seryl-tRNA synthetase [Vulcanisaeta moutnovskia 768-28]
MSWSLLDALRNRPDTVRDSLRKRRMDVGIVDRFIELDNKWRSLKAEIDELRHKHNVITREVSKLKGTEREGKIKEAKELLNEIQKKEEELENIEREREKVLRSIPNLVHESVPYDCPGGIDSIPARFYGTPKVWIGHAKEFKDQTERFGFNVPYETIDWKPIGHADMLEVVLGMGDTLKAGEVAGSRFYYLFDDLVMLDMALLTYAIDYMTKKGFKLVLPPYMLKYEVLSEILDMDTFKDMVYKVENEDLYLIGTAEHPIAAYLRHTELLEDQLPLLFVGVSPSFRREASAGNRDMKGIFRVHQFHKVEQFVFSLPEDSWRWHEELIRNAEELWQGLGLPYRVVLLCAHDMGRCAAKQYDLEVWMPAQGMYREMVSCSNCTDWQSAKLGIRVLRKDMRREFVHTLNSTAIASTRTITAILENYQEPDGTVVIPKALRRYLEIFSKGPIDAIYPKRKVKRDDKGNPVIG